MKSLASLDKRIHTKAIKAFDLLRKNMRHPSLNVEKILEDIYTARVTEGYRLVHQLEDDQIRLLFIGQHDDSYRFIKNIQQTPTEVVHEPIEPYVTKQRKRRKKKRLKRKLALPCRPAVWYRKAIVLTPDKFLCKDIGTLSTRLFGQLFKGVDVDNWVFARDARGRITDIISKSKRGITTTASRKATGTKTFIYPSGKVVWKKKRYYLRFLKKKKK
jgi:mRNA-degrading endonuclease RelE of RelBE toxin-antitoxin system